MDVERTALPGIGLRHMLTTARGRRIGTISHRDGRRDLLVYDRDDPDTCVLTVPLTVEEANALAELLGTARIVERLAELHRQVEGLVSEQISITAGSPYDGRPLGDTRARTRTGASIVALVREGVPLYLLAGLAFGAGGILPLTTSSEFVSVGAEVGVILLLFTLGLEYTPDELVATLRTSAPVGLTDLALNAAPGVIAALLLGWGPVMAVALGGVTYVTSSGITAKMIGDLGWLGNRETPSVLSVLVFEDLTMAAYLPILTALLAGAGVLGGTVALLIAAATITVILFVALRHGAIVERFVASPSREVLLLKVLGLTLLVAGLAQQLQVSAAVGAFLVGIAVSGPLVHEARQLITPLRDLFAAVFFVFFGLHIDPADLPPVAGIAALLALAGIATKGTTGWLAARRAGVAATGRLRAGASLVPRGEFNIVIAGLAVTAGTDSRLGPLAAAYVLILAIAGPLLARTAEPFARLVRG